MKVLVVDRANFRRPVKYVVQNVVTVFTAVLDKRQANCGLS